MIPIRCRLRRLLSIHSPNGMFCKWHVRPIPYCKKCKNYQVGKHCRSLGEIAWEGFQEGIKEVKGGVNHG